MVYVNSKSQEIQAAKETADKFRDFDYFFAEIGSYFTNFNVIKEYESLYLTKTNATGQMVKQVFRFRQANSPFEFQFWNRIEKNGIELLK